MGRVGVEHLHRIPPRSRPTQANGAEHVRADPSGGVVPTAHGVHVTSYAGAMNPTADSPDAVDSTPVVLVHGWGGSFTTTWERSGFTMLLADANRPVIGVDLLGHGDAPKPHDPEAYGDLAAGVLQAIDDAVGPDGDPVDAVGFSLGAMTLIRAAMQRPGRFRRLVLAGVGNNVFERDEEATAAIVAAIESDSDTSDHDADNRARLFAQYAHQPGNDPVALAAIMKRPPSQLLRPADLAAITCPVLVAVGDRDFVLPAEPLVDALPDARFVSLKRTDHFATPESFAFIDATLEFLDAVPG
ncbi:MAG: alpha/beta hydrolase [Acidimicrobiaceae bacterium]|nr:alpha/beta hydrolase [Acidimicrobiaceae bacterium]